MATYGSLLIDAGGGVIDRHKQSDKQQGATVIIGLGGTGSDAVIKLKREVYKQLQPDEPDAVIPKHDNIRYLIIDSDAAKVRASKGRISDIDESTEFFSISNKAIKATFASTDILKNRRELDWLDYEHISIDDASAGAGGIRQVGRFLLVDKAAQLYAKIKSTFQSALIGAKGKLTVHICAGISGGTGSGTFLDVCYLVREVLKELGRPETNVCGYFFLPDVNLSVPTISSNTLISEFISVNGFAALKELDYCMNFGKNKDSFKMNYGFREINDAQKPVDLCYLISTTNQAGDMIPNGYEYAMGVVTDFIISFLAKVQLPPGVTAESDTSGITLEGHISNLNSIRAGIKLQHGASVDYNVLGASVAEMPLSEIATYLGYKLFECYSAMYDRVPTESDRDNFLSGAQLKYEDIRKALTKGCPGSIAFPNRLDAKHFKERGNSQFVKFADEEYLAKNKGVLEKNATTFMEEMKDFAIPKESTSLIGRTYKGLCDKYVTQFAFGPFFAQRMLYGTQNQNLIHAVDGFIKQNDTNLEAELRQEELRISEYDDALDRMQHAGLLNEKKRLGEYLNALNNLYVHHYRVAMYQTMDTVLRAYREQLSKLNSNFFRVLTTVLDTIRETFEENGKVLTKGVKSKNTYSWKILDVPNVAETLDKEVEQIDLQNTLYDLMTTMMDNCKKWINADENEITKLISDFVLTSFSTATQKTISDYLSIKFNVPKANLQELADKIENSIIRDKLGEDSTPLFWNNPMYHSVVGMNSTLTVPYNSAEIKTAANGYASKQTQFLVRESNITDKISMMRFYSGLPMYAYQGLLELQNKYEKDSKPGRHLYERGEVNWNKWIPSPIPASFKTGIPIQRIEKRNQELLSEFEEAEKLGVVKFDEQLKQWEIQKTEDFNADAYIEEKGGYITNGKIDSNKIKALIDGLESEKQRLAANAGHVWIECGNANVGSEKQVMLDFYLASPVLNKLLREELQKHGVLENKIKELADLAGRVITELEEKKNFFNAIFTGVLSYGKTIVYTYDEFGMEKKVILQNPEMEFGDTGAYQAYITYKDLDETIKKKIVKESKSRMGEDDNAEVKETVNRLDESMAKKIASYTFLHDETDPIHEDLKKFYNEFMKAFHAFKLMVD